jgi:hypothetical protein
MNITVNTGVNSKAVASLLVGSKNIVSRVKDNPLFPDAIFKEPVTELDTAVQNLYKVASEERTGQKASRVRAARKEVNRCLRVLTHEVDKIANRPGLDDDWRETIVLSAGMKVRQVRPRRPQTFEAKRGDKSGTVLLKAKGGVYANEWQSTTDLVEFSNRVTHTTTTKAKTLITGLTPKVKHAFFHRAIVSGKETSWEGPIFLEVL